MSEKQREQLTDAMLDTKIEAERAYTMRDSSIRLNAAAHEIEAKIEAMRRNIMPSRELSVALTNLETGVLWLQAAAQKLNTQRGDDHDLGRPG